MKVRDEMTNVYNFAKEIADMFDVELVDCIGFINGKRHANILLENPSKYELLVFFLGMVYVVTVEDIKRMNEIANEYGFRFARLEFNDDDYLFVVDFVKKED